ncbi:MAG TPA: DUF4625 domain-containing protein [Chitinophagales bacterium]|nr:DUF4625 domain-containing protein [Chitinophagales bacterium]
MKTTIKTLTTAFILIAALAFTISGCSKKENMAPVIDIEEPTNNRMISLGDSIHIEGVVTDDESLHEMSVIVTNTANVKVLEEYPTVHELSTYSFHYHFHPMATGTYTLTVTAEDHDGKAGTATRTFMVM